MPEDTSATHGDGADRRAFSIDVDGPRVSLDRLISTAESALTLLREVDVEITHKSGGALDWVVSDLQSGSVHLEAKPELKDLSLGSETAVQVLAAVGEGLELVEHEAARPSHFNDSALKSARELTGALREEGISRVRVRTNGRSVEISQRLAAHVDELIKGKVKSIGSVEGRLETVSLHGSAYFNVYERISGKGVRCYFSEDRLEEVKKALGERVRVSGVIWSRRTGEVVSIQVREIEVFPDESDLPPAEAMRGVLENG